MKIEYYIEACNVDAAAYDAKGFVVRKLNFHEDTLTILLREPRPADSSRPQMQVTKILEILANPD